MYAHTFVLSVESSGFQRIHATTISTSSFLNTNTKNGVFSSSKHSTVPGVETKASLGYTYIHVLALNEEGE